MINRDNSDRDNDDQTPKFKERVLGKMYEIYISTAIGSPESYIDMLDLFRSAHVNDTIALYLNTPGGRLDAGRQILAAMKDSRATVVTIMDGDVASMGAFLFLAGNERIVNDHTILMLHNYSAGGYGKAHEMRSYFDSNDRIIASMLREYGAEFLSDDEIERIIKGEDMYLMADEVRDRLDVAKEAKKATNESEKEYDLCLDCDRRVASFGC